MNPLRTLRRAALLLAASLALLAPAAILAAPVLPAAAATAGSGTTVSHTGWIRLAHLSPDTPAVDVYLYAFGNPNARIVLRHVAYGDVSPFLAVPAGDYSVAMRAAGDAASSLPVLSSSAWVDPGTAYTALAVGPRSDLRLRIFHDPLTTPAGKALVRVVQASMKHPRVTVSWDGKVIASELAFASVTSYQAVSPGAQIADVTAGGKGSRSAVTLTAGSIHTLIVLDGPKGLEIANLEDADGSSQLPRGGAPTGFGGTAPHGPGSPRPWLAVIVAGSVLAAGGGLGLRRGRRGASPLRTLASGA